MTDSTSGAQQPREFNALDSGTRYWDIGRTQPALLARARSSAIQGRVLDAARGVGRHAPMAVALGLEATRTDSAPAAVARALVENASQLAAHAAQFNTTPDCGRFHVLADAARREYVDSLRQSTRPGSWRCLLCCSARQRDSRGPRHRSQDEIGAIDALRV